MKKNCSKKIRLNQQRDDLLDDWTKKELIEKINLDSREESEVFEDNCSEDDFSKKQGAKGLGVHILLKYLEGRSGYSW